MCRLTAHPSFPLLRLCFTLSRLTPELQSWIERLRAGDALALTRAISTVENRVAGWSELAGWQTLFLRFSFPSLQTRLPHPPRFSEGAPHGTSTRCSSVTACVRNRRLTLLRAQPPATLLRFRLPALCHLQLLSTPRVSGDSSPARSVLAGVGAGAAGVPVYRGRLCGHARARSSSD
jgi:hypothetical protein